MLKQRTGKRIAVTSLLAAFSLMLTGCFASPGKFTSELVLQTNNDFSFTYNGEIFFLGLSKLAQMGAAMDADEFTPSECYDEDTFEYRACTEEEIAEEKAIWDDGADARAAKKKREAEIVAKMLGGLDPSDPAAADELAKRLQRQKGWNMVKHTGDGVFAVEFATNGTLSHDFVFPLIEKVPAPTMFVQVFVREENKVRVEAPGFAVEDGGATMSGMLGSIAGLAALDSGGGEMASMPDVPEMEGTFTISTNAQILANNTDEGPSNVGGGQKLVWEISKRTKTAPTALIQLGE